MIAIVSAFVILLFGTHSLYGAYAQGFAVVLISGAAISILIGRKNLVQSSSAPLIFLLLAIVMPMQSAVVGLLREANYQVWYAFGFMVMVVSSRILVQHYGVRRLVNLYIISAAVMCVICVVFEANQLRDSLAITITETGLMRFSPFENHPNLIGHIFGLSAALATVRLLLPIPTHWKIWHAMVAASSLVFVLGASSRGGLLSAILAAGLAASVWVKDNFGWGTIKRYMAIAGGLLLVVAGLWAAFGDGWIYLMELLEFDHIDRGLDAGLTGRVAGWPFVLERVANDNGAVFWGFGFRSWDTWAEGNLAIDNSYVELIHDFGYFVAAFVVQQIMWNLWKVTNDESATEEKYLIICVVLYILIESMVTRYMLGIGNPASLLILFVFCSTYNENRKILNYA